MSSRIPLFPLNTVLYPGLVLPLHIFEQRYRRLVRDLLALPDPARREFGIVAIREGREVGKHPEALHAVGCMAALREVDPFDDGRFDITTVGTRRFRIRSVDDDEPYLSAEVDFLEEEHGGNDEELSALSSGVTRAFARYRAAVQGAPEELDHQAVSGLEGEIAASGDGHDVDVSWTRSDESWAQGPARGRVPSPTVISYAVAAAMVLPADDKQALLAASDTAARLREERVLLGRERNLIRAIPSLPGVDLVYSPVSSN